MTVQNLFNLEGRTALITGATGYLGEQMSWALAEAGALVLINSRSHSKASALADKICQAGFRARAAAFDIVEEKDLKATLDEVTQGALHILINNAYSGGSGTISTASAKDYTESYNVSVVAAHNLIQAALPLLREAVKRVSDASIINISSMYGMVSPDLRIYKNKLHANPPFYGTVKAALLQLTKYAACEYGPEGIRVNCLSPGPFPNPDVQEAQADFIADLSNKVPMSRIGQAHEIQGPVLFLASSASSFVNGTNIPIDGGWTAW